jgi:polyisoprenoid-binding protein YceI
MSTTPKPSDTPLAELTAGTWRLDPARSSVEFHVPHFWGLITVKGRFERYEGTLGLQSEPAVELTIDAASVDTGNRKRDQHLRSADFFDVERHPQVRFVSDTAVLDGETLQVRGHLHAAGKSIALELDISLHTAGDGEVEIEAVTHAEHRELGMTWSPLGMARPISKLVVKGRLRREPDNGR